MLTCIIRYQIDPFQREAFRRYAQRWLEIIPRCGGELRGYWLPHEGTNDIAWGLISFPSLAAYEKYREGFGKDPEFIAADKIRDESGCVVRYDRSFMRPLLPG